MEIEIDNLKCGGCENSIIKGLSAMPDIEQVVVDQEKQTVRFFGVPTIRESVTTKLKSMGYPEKGTLKGLDAGLANAKSHVSCAIGRIT
ncbi:MAG: heavy-metal-associated domain-containing protein [Limnohabitans sp.]|nr:heavy-metal-associated domain-containing protein [Limnohabitans sp.]